MARPSICAVITTGNAASIDDVKRYADLFELRIDIIGDGWERIAGSLDKPWIACCRSKKEGGRWQGSESKRIGTLLAASGLGAAIVDIELSTANLEKVVPSMGKNSRCLLSFHDYKKTPPAAELEDIVKKQIAAGADICKVVTTAQSVEDNLTVLGLMGKFPGRKIVAFAMGAQGALSRVLCPLAGGSFTYASVATGQESAPGQMTAADLRKVYAMVNRT